MQYNIIIPSSEKDILFLRWVIRYIRMNLPEAEIIYILAKSRCKNIVDRFLGHEVVFVNEDNLVKSLSYENVKEYLKKKNYEVERTGWYFQQFLKMAFAQSNFGGDYYLSWDSDTLPLSHIDFFNQSHPVFTLKKEYHKPYFTIIKKIIGLDKIREESFIAEHMMFSKNIMNDLLDEIRKKDSSKLWWQIILDSIDVTGEGNYFSEFETYGTYAVTKYPDLYRFQRLNTFRSAGLIKGRCIDDKLIARLSIDLDIASFEIQDERFPYNYEKIKYKLIRKYKNIYRLIERKRKD